MDSWPVGWVERKALALAADSCKSTKQGIAFYGSEERSDKCEGTMNSDSGYK